MSALEEHLSRQIEHSRGFFWHRLRWKVVSEYLPRDESFTLVDVGAGAGLLGEFLRREFPLASYQFVEPIGALAAALEVRFGSESNVETRERYAGAQYVTLLDVLEHQEDDRAFLADLAGRLDPGAVLLLTVPALRSLWSGWDVSLGHFRRYERSTLLRAADVSGLRPLEVSYLFPELIPPGLWRRRSRPPAEAGAASAEFPDLPKPVNEVLYLVGRASLRLRLRWPAGTSLLGVFVRE